MHKPEEQERRLKMGKILYVGTYGTDEPTRASLPFLFSVGAMDGGHEPSIVLVGEAVYLLKRGIADSVQGVGYPPLRQLMDKVAAGNVPVYA
ncbi:MAG: hypothetical protein ACYC55_10180 [Candidatus Geothermincolia bacterium]